MRDWRQSMYQRHSEMLERATITDEDLHAATATLGGLERCWTGNPDIKVGAV